MGYSMQDDKEIYTIEEITRQFDIKRIGLSGAVFDLKKLDWINQQYMINSIKVEDLWPRIREWGFNDAFMARLMPLAHTRIKTFGDFMDLCGFFFVNKLQYTKETLCPRGLEPEAVAMILQSLIWSLDEKEKWNKEDLEASSREISEIFGIHFKKEMIPILFATFTGKTQGPPLFDSFDILGPHKSRARILEGIEFLGGISNKKLKDLEEGWAEKQCNSLISKAN
jgi:glutamyl-tRNA synthetase